MADKENSFPSPSKEDKAPPKALPVEGDAGKKEAIPQATMVPENGKKPENQDTTRPKTDIEVQKKVVEVSKKALTNKQRKLQQISIKKNDEEEAQGTLLSWPDAPQSPSAPSLIPEDSKTPLGELALQKTKPLTGVELSTSQKQQQAGENLREQENITAKAIQGKMEAELESVTKDGNLDQLPPDAQKKIRTEIVRTSIHPQLLPDEKKKEILSTMKGADGQPMFDMSLVDLKNLTPSQKEFILNSPDLKNTISQTVEEYKRIQNEAKKTGKKPDPEIIKKIQLQLGLPNTDALDLSQIRPGIKLTEYPVDTQMGVVQRILAESTFNELRDTLSDGMKWSHVPEMVRREIIVDSFSAESDKNSSDIQQAIIEAKAMVASPDFAKKEGESAAQFDARFKEKTGVASSNLEVLALESRKSGLSPQMRAWADFFGPIGAALGISFWKEYMGQNLGQDEIADTSERYMTKDGNNEYTGEVGTQSPELAKNGFKGDVMNSIWRWEYQKGHNVEVVPAGKSGLTLCGGIDLAYTPYSKVQNIFQGILKPETIAKLQPFCDNGRRGPIRGQAESLLRTKAGLKEEINGQLNYQNMGEAFTRSLSIDWQRLVNKHGSVVKNAPGYIQVFMLSRFYHAGIGGSSTIIKKIIAAGFDHSAVVSIAENFRNTRSESYYRNRMGKEISYLKSRPGDAVPPIAQDGKGVELSQKQSPVQWFQENAGKPYGSGKGKWDCMTSTHAALGLDYTNQYAGAFNGKFIDQKDDEHNLWNVAMASALYVGNISSANSDAKDGIIKKKSDGYYGEKANDISNMEYYIEENVMKRVNDSSDGMVDVGNSSKLIHYSKSKRGVSGIVEDIKNRLKPGESAMMGGTGAGTNKGGHEWLVYNDNGVVKAYDATSFGGQGVSGTGMELSSFLNNPRRSKYPQEAIIFAKKSEPSSSRDSRIS